MACGIYHSIALIRNGTVLAPKGSQRVQVKKKMQKMRPRERSRVVFFVQVQCVNMPAG